MAGTLLAAIGTSSVLGDAEAADAVGPLKIMPLGDSITLGNGPAHSYRGFLWQSLVDAGVSFDFVGSYGNIVPPGGEPTWAWAEDVQKFYSGPIDKDMEGHGGFQAGQPESVVGYKDHMLAQMVPTDIPLFEPDIILLHIGTNDLLGGWTTHGPWHGPLHDWDHRVELSAQNVVDLIDAIHALRPGVTILVSPIGKASLGGIQQEFGAMSALIGDAVAVRAAQGRNVAMVADAYDAIVAADLSDGIHLTDNGSRKLAAAWFRALQPYLGGAGGGTLTVTSVTAGGSHRSGSVDVGTVVIRNDGPTAAPVAVSIALSGSAAGRTAVRSSQARCTTTGLVATCTAVALASGSSITIDADIAVSGSGGYTLSGTLAGMSPTALEVGTSGPNCTVLGGFGTDVLSGSDAADVLCGFDGDDTFAPGAGTDVVLGGAGADTVTYLSVSTGVRVDLAAGTAVDVGGSGVGADALLEVEHAKGGSGPDELAGTDGVNQLYGNGGADRLVGRGGNDKLFGNGGSDTFDGGAGRDRCVQGAGNGTKVACELV